MARKSVKRKAEGAPRSRGKKAREETKTASSATSAASVGSATSAAAKSGKARSKPRARSKKGKAARNEQEETQAAQQSSVKANKKQKQSKQAAAGGQQPQEAQQQQGQGDADSKSQNARQDRNKPLNFGKLMRGPTGIRRYEDQAIDLASMPQEHMEAVVKTIFEVEEALVVPTGPGLSAASLIGPNNKPAKKVAYNIVQAHLAVQGLHMHLERVHVAGKFTLLGRLPFPNSDTEVVRIWEGDEARHMRLLSIREADELWYNPESAWYEKTPTQVYDAIQLKVALEQSAHIMKMRGQLQEQLDATSQVEEELGRMSKTPAEKEAAQNAIRAARASAAEAQDLLQNHPHPKVVVKLGPEQSASAPGAASGPPGTASGPPVAASAHGAASSSSQAPTGHRVDPNDPGFSAWVRENHNETVREMTLRAKNINRAQVSDEERRRKQRDLTKEVTDFYERLQDEWLSFSKEDQDRWTMIGLR